MGGSQSTDRLLNRKWTMTNSKNVPAQWAVRVLLAKIGEALDKATLGTPASHLSGLKKRETLEAQFDGRCVYCNTKTNGNGEADHLIPTNKKHLGTHSIGNLVLSCRKCNLAKGSKTLDEYLSANPKLDGKVVRARIKGRKGMTPKPVDVERVRRSAEALYVQVATLVEQAYVEAIEELGIKSESKTAKKPATSSATGIDYSQVSHLFPLDSLVESKKRDVLGLVVTYSMQGPKGSRTAYIGIRDIATGKVIHRAPSTLTVLRTPNEN